MLLLTFLSENVRGQCDVFITPNSVNVIDNNPGVQFEFEITNNTSSDYDGGTLYMAWTLSSSDPIWQFELDEPIPPGGSYVVSTPKLDMPAVWDGDLNIFSAPSNQPTPDNPWLESNDWYFYTQPFPYPGPLGNGSWVPVRLYLDGCTLFDAEQVYDDNGELYYGPSTDGCVNIVEDQFCDRSCSLEIINFNVDGFTLYAEGTECFNYNQFPRQNTIDSFVTSFVVGNPIVCTGNVNYVGFEPMESGDTVLFDFFEYALPSGNLTCLNDLINAAEIECRTTLSVSNPNILNPLILQTSSYTLNINESCELLLSNPDIGVDSLTYQLGGCTNEPLYWIPEINLTNYGTDVVTELCLEFSIWNVDGVEPDTVCFDNLNILPGQSTILDLPVNYNGGDDLLLITTTLLSSNGLSEDFDSNNTLNSQFIMWCYDCVDPDADNYNQYATNPQDPDNCEYLGCTDINANNYDPTANTDDGSCEYLGCTDPQAFNYDENANIDDGSCIYEGCTDPNALNYDPTASVDDGSCLYDVLGCTDVNADNYNPNATIDDGNCIYYGCTDPEAYNYDSTANTDNGSCEYYTYGCTDMNALNYNPEADIEDGTCVYPGPCDEFDGTAFAPNAFTPNNDGLNDVWRVITDIECWNRWELIIYNRWGQIVYEMNDPSQVWNGSFRGGEYYVPDGVYAYTLRGVSHNFEPIEVTGVITVLR